MKTKKVESYKATARNNAEKAKNAAQIAAGDFLYLVTGYGKENGLCDYIRTQERGNGPTLVKVVAVVDVPESFDLLRGWMAQPAPEHRGGSQSDDIAEDHTPYNYTPEEIDTYFQLVTVYRNGKGQFIAVDCQGYDYWRYVYLSAYWREMFAEEAEAIAKEYAEEQRAMAEAERKEREREADTDAAITLPSEDINYMFYIKPKGAKRFSTYNPGKGTMNTGRVFTELYRKEHLSTVCKWIAEDKSGDFVYQLRSGDGKRIFWEHNPTAATSADI